MIIDLIKRAAALGGGLFLLGMGAGGPLGVDWYVSGAVGAMVGVSLALGTILLGYARDGHLTREEINDAFSKAAQGSKKKDK